MQNRCIRLAVACVLAAALVPLAAAQPWPTRPVRIMVGASPGGGTDIIARMLAEKLPGDVRSAVRRREPAGRIQHDRRRPHRQGAPDGHTLLVATNTAQAIAPHLLKLGYDPLKDLAPVALIVVVPNVLVVEPRRPGEQREGADGADQGQARFVLVRLVGHRQHAAPRGRGVQARGRNRGVHVPYKGSSQALADLVGGQIQLNFDTTSSAMGFIKGGKVKALAVMTPKRIARSCPTCRRLAEAGLPDVEMSTWYGLFVTAGTPQGRCRSPPRRDDEGAQAARRPEAPRGARRRARQRDRSATRRARSEPEYERFGRLIRAANIRLQQ